MGRNPMGDTPMSNAERQRAHRERIKRQGLVAEYVNQDLRGDYFDVEARLAKALRGLVHSEVLSEEICKRIMSDAVGIIPPRNRIDMLFIEKKLNEYLNIGENKNGEEHE